MYNIDEQKVPQNNPFMRSGQQITPLSGNRLTAPQFSARDAKARASVNAKNVACPFAPYPTNRKYAWFPIAKGTRQTGKLWMRALADNDIDTVEAVPGVLANNQEQPTFIRVMDRQEAKKASTKEIFRDYHGNVTGDHSLVKHADDATKSSPSLSISSQNIGFKTNPIIESQLKMSKEYAKLISKLHSRIPKRRY